VHSWYTLTSDCYETAEGYTAMTRKNKLNKYIASIFLVGIVAHRSRRRSFVAFSRVFHAFLTCFWRLPDPVCQNFGFAEIRFWQTADLDPLSADDLEVNI